jgi:hypothetical protein
VTTRRRSVQEAFVSVAADGDKESWRGELRRASTTTNEASASAAAEKERVLNGMSGVGEEEDRRMGGRTCEDVWAWTVALWERLTICA